jgi:hypothetical protein
MRRCIGRLVPWLAVIALVGCTSSTSAPNLPAPIVEKTKKPELEAGGDPRAVVELALKARCTNPEDFDKQKTQKIILDGKLYLVEQAGTSTHREIQFDGLSRVRWDAEYAFPDGKRVWAMTLAGDSGWQLKNGEVQDLSFSEAAEFKMEIYGRYFATLIPLMDKSITLTLLPDAQASDEAASVVKATARFRPDVLLYFSKKTNHLLKISYKAREQGSELRKEHILSDYKSIQGLMLPTTFMDMLQQEGGSITKAAQYTIKEYQFLPKLGDEIFGKPAPKK